MKVCPYCGLENPSHAQSCAECDADLSAVPAGQPPVHSSPQPRQAPTRDVETYERNEEYEPRDLRPFMGRCPECGSSRIQIVTEGQTKGFGTGKGCCGAILLGPLGFLLGLCGMGKGKNEAIRMCLNCGAKF